MTEMKCKHCGAEVILIRGRDSYFKTIDPSSYDGERSYEPDRHMLHSESCPAQKKEQSPAPVLTPSEKRARGIA